jgi:hypothetical protein
MKYLTLLVSTFFLSNLLVSQTFKQSPNTDVVGQRIFSVDNSASFPRNYTGAAVFDFNGDGLKDFIIPSYYSPMNNYDVQYLKFFKNLGNGTFTEVTKQYVNPDVTNGLYLIGSNDGKAIVFDFNKDGKMDFAFPSLWENNNYIDYDKTYGIKKLKDYYYKYNGNYIESRANGGFASPAVFYQDSVGIKKAFSLFDKTTFVASQAVNNADINNDGFDDLLFWQVGYLAKDSAITGWLNGITIWQNDAGKGFKYNQLNFLDTLNKSEFATDEEGSIGIADYNGDGFKDILVFGTKTPYIYNRFNEKIDSSSFDRNYRQYDNAKKIRETRLYLNNKGIFDEFNYVIIPGIRAKYSKSIDLNNDGKMDFIALWKNYLAGGKIYNDSSTNKDGINSQIYVCINKGNNLFEDQTLKYFPSNNTKFSRMSMSDIELKDLDGDGFLDVFPISGVMDTMYNTLGNYANDTAGSHATYYYKNYSNNYFKKMIIDSFFKVKEWANFKDLKNLDSLYLNYYIPYSSKYDPTPNIKGQYLLDELYYLNNLYVEDFNGDKKIDLLGFSNMSNRFQSFMINKYGFNDNLKLQIGMTLFTQCASTRPIFNEKNFTICGSDSLKLSISGPTKSETFKWYFNNKVDSSNTSSLYFKDPIKVYVVKTDSIGCVYSSDTIQLAKSVIPNTPVIFRDTANYLVSGVIGTTWYKDGVLLSDTTQKIKPLNVGSYAAKTTQNGCSSALSNPYYYLLTDIIKLSSDEFIKLAPNPFNSILNFDFNIKGYQKLNLEVFEISTGNKVRVFQNLLPGQSINIGNLTSGTYLVKVSTSDNKIVQQFKMVKL